MLRSKRKGQVHLSRAQRDDLGIGYHEKVLAAGVEFVTDDLLIATTRALYQQASKKRIRWDQIGKAAWAQPHLRVTLIDAKGASAETLSWELVEPADLPAAVHDRVTASVVVTERTELAPGASALLVARRNADEDTIWWAVVLESGVNPKDPQLLALAGIALKQLRESLGV